MANNDKAFIEELLESYREICKEWPTETLITLVKENMGDDCSIELAVLQDRLDMTDKDFEVWMKLN